MILKKLGLLTYSKLCLLICLSALIFFLSSKPTLAYVPPDDTPTPTPSCVSDADRTFCGDSNKGEDQHSIYKVECKGGHTKINTCYLSQDQDCSGNSCQTVYKTEISITPSNPNLGDYPITIKVQGTGTCSQNISLDPGPGLHNLNNYQTPTCDLTSTDCSDHNPPDQSYKCTWQYQCIAYELSTNASTLTPTPGAALTPYTTTFTGSGNSSCTSSSTYTVGLPAQCVTPSPGTKDIIDPNGDKNSSTLVAKSLDDDKVFAQAINQSSMPDNLNQQALAQCSSSPPQIGVQLGFSVLQSIQSILCSSTLVSLIGLSKILYCPINENFANNQTNCYASFTQNVSQTSNPDNLIKVPAQNSCYLQDIYTKPSPSPGDNSAQTVGNQEFNQISADSASKNGYLVANAPDNITGYTPDHDNKNVSVRGTVVNGDLRAPDINCAAQKFLNLNFPPGLIPPYFTNFGCSTTNAPAPAPGGVVGCPGKSNWFLNNNPLGNFGDQNCNFTKDKLASLIQQKDSTDFNEWFFVIAPCESGFNPDSYNPVSRSGSAWGLFQMGGGTNAGLNGQWDYGNVDWPIQTSNALNYHLYKDPQFVYWACSDYYKHK